MDAWSITMSTITKPRIQSMAAMRVDERPGVSAGSGSTGAVLVFKLCAVRECFSDRRSGFFQETSEDQCQNDAIQQRFKTSLVVRQFHPLAAFRHLDQHPAEQRPKQGAEGEVYKINY